MSISSVADLASSWDSNKVYRSHWFKTTSPVITTGGFWIDTSMAAGTPKYNPYVGNALQFTPLIGGGNNGINAGVGGDSYITRYSFGGGSTGNAWPATLMLADYVGFYPLVDMDSTDVQAFDNSTYTSRYSSGMRLMVVTTIPQTAPSATEVIVTYEGSNNVTTVARFWIFATAAAGGINCLTSANTTLNFTAPFVPLGYGTADVQRLISVEVTGPSGGFCAFVLVKPILETVVYDLIAPHELEFPRNKVPPFVPANAYLSHVACPVTGTGSSTSRGHIVFARE